CSARGRRSSGARPPPRSGTSSSSTPSVSDSRSTLPWAGAARGEVVWPRVKILVTGSRGLIGSALIPQLTSRGHRVARLVRGDPGAAPDQIPWDPEAGRLDGARLEGADAAIHLAGESIAAGRWTGARKARIRRSRVESTRLLADTLGRLERKPGVLIVASAVGYYGNRGNEILVEDSAPG